MVGDRITSNGLVLKVRLGGRTSLVRSINPLSKTAFKPLSRIWQGIMSVIIHGDDASEALKPLQKCPCTRDFLINRRLLSLEQASSPFCASEMESACHLLLQSYFFLKTMDKVAYMVGPGSKTMDQLLVHWATLTDGRF